MSIRQQLLQRIAEQILALPAHSIVRVGIDGVDGVGKSTFADELAPLLANTDRPVIRASVDGFHNPRAVRYQRGPHSPEGFYYDSYNYAQLKAVLLDPLSPGGSRIYRTAIFDHSTDSVVEMPAQLAAPGTILLFDGIFLHRPDLRDYWDFSIFLDAPFTVTVPRGAARDNTAPDPAAPSQHRYVAGQQLYLAECQPQRHATLVVDNSNLEAPFIVADLLP